MTDHAPRPVPAGPRPTPPPPCPRSHRQRWFRFPKFRPPSDGLYLVHIPGAAEPVFSVYYDSRRHVWHSGYRDRDLPGVTHWMHLPEPPKG